MMFMTDEQNGVGADIPSTDGQTRAQPSTLDTDDSSVVEMSATVDVSQMDELERRMIHKLARIFEENFTEVVAKNKDYGFSFLKTGAKLSSSAGTPFETAPRSQMYGLLTRSGDKRERVVENVFGDGAADVSDTADTTCRENANYWNFMAAVLRHPQLATALGEDESLPSSETS